MYRVIMFHSSGTTTLRFDDLRKAYEYAVALDGIVLGGTAK